MQFKRYANIYFLVSAIIQSIPILSPLNPFSAISPLVFVLALSMIREGRDKLYIIQDLKIFRGTYRITRLMRQQPIFIKEVKK